MTGDELDLLEMGQKFLGMVKDRSWRDNCVFGFSLEDGSVKTTPGGYCHGYVMNPRALLRTDKIKLVAINTRIQKYSVGYDTTFGKDNGGLLPKGYFDEYYDFLFNRSVFANCYVTKTTEGLRDGGVVVVRCDTGPANLMAAACIAIRRGWEYPLMSKSLVNMLRMGIEPNLAHLVSYQLTVDSKGKSKDVQYGDHQSIHSNHLDKSGVKNLREGRLPQSTKYNTKIYQELCTYRGLYGMWNDSGQKARDTSQRSLRFKSNTMRINPYRDPFNIIVKLAIKPKETIADVIEEGLQLL